MRVWTGFGPTASFSTVDLRPAVLSTWPIDRNATPSGRVHSTSSREDVIMKLSPISRTTEPTYPTYIGVKAPPWKKIAAAVAVASALWLPACGSDDTGPEREAGAMQPIEARMPGAMPVQNPPTPDPPKPPEIQPPVLPEPVRLGGAVAPVAPPPPIEPPPQVRLGGRARSPEPPKSLR